ncbi:hypothetical protein BS47DRAFT_1366980 [Hydnum rufescens UP504]|uniref:Uncharacterized protein n=1 Tax=Hydnum rufescens UP504 TaxID=1448309 RepID=A0A9P6DQ49_9AGAM|nr:hypothetical protein BS47DRAFT_1366980 [Hydnum rufescens UP504]
MDSRSALWEAGRDETVEVNQRALIDKNADDAQATRVEIRFETPAFVNFTQSHGTPESLPAILKRLPDLKTEIMSRWIFKNDGVAFREEDWNRLKKIAEGNPDEGKIGAFLYVRRGDYEDSGVSQPLSISPLLRTATPTGRMKVKGISSTKVQIRASVLRLVYLGGSEKTPQKPRVATTGSNFFSSFISSFKTPVPTSPQPVSPPISAPDPLDVLDSSVQVQIFSAQVDVKLPNKLAQELERATKKRPPSSYSYQLIYTGKDEYDASVQEDETNLQIVGSIFKGLRADLDSLSIKGHATAQTTGMGGHHASRFIPTVEREAIDLVDQAVSVWNTELLGVGGLLCRAVYEHELSDIRNQWKALDAQLDPTSEIRSSLELRFVHVLRFFTFHASTPSGIVSRTLEDTFFQCAKDDSITILSTAGVMSARDVRYPEPPFLGFLKHLPVLPTPVLEPASAMVLNLRQRGLLSDIMFSDVLRELRSRPLTEAEMVECLKWRIGLPEAVILAHRQELTAEFLDAAHNRMTTSPEFAEQVFNILAKSWNSLPQPEQQHIIQLLGYTPCVPTVLGMKKPKESYFPNVNMFHDLPIINLPGPLKADKERLVKYSFGLPAFGADLWLSIKLLSLGVRKHVDLQLIFSRYLVSVRESLSPLEMDKLRDTRVFRASGGPSEANGIIPPSPPQRYTAAELYEPSPIHLSLQFPVLDWEGDKWRTNSPEAHFWIYGLRLSPRHQSPSLEDVLHRAASEVPEQRDTALHFFFDQFNSLYASTYKVTDFSNVAFVPAVKVDGTECLSTPTEVFVEKESAVMGFCVVKDQIRAEATLKLQLQYQPPTSLLISRLVANPPRALPEAQMVFEYLAGRFSAADLKQLKETPFIPFVRVDKSLAKFIKPSECYIGESAARLHSRVFTFVDFGKRASVFLQACGTKLEPSSQQIAEMLISNPKRFYELSGGSESYLEELRRIASNVGRIEKATQERMRRTPILLGLRRTMRDNAKAPPDDSDDEGNADLEYQLLRPSEIVIVDDTNAYRIFRNDIWVAPQDDLIETFYANLGAPPLSTVVQEECISSADAKSQKLALDTRALVLERLPLFLHDQRGHRTTFKFDWLNQDDNFKVKTVGKLLISSELVFGGKKIAKSRPASAGAKKDERGSLVLYLAENDRLDYYELKLRALKRRGYNVDRILNQQKLDRENREAAARELKQRTFGQPIETRTEENLMNGRKELPSAPKSDAIAAPSGGLMTAIQDIFRGPFSELPRSSPRPSGVPENSSGPFESFGAKPTFVDPRTRVTPTQDIGSERLTYVWNNGERNMQLALSSCREEKSDRVQNRSQMSVVKEANEGSYCDITGETDIFHAGDICGYKVYMAQKLYEVPEVFKQKLAVLQRFSEVIDPLRDQVYRIPSRSVAIFYDLEGPLIAFNRGGSIFLNLRYYEAWHDPQVMKGDLVQARISWYFVLAHEIAHNLVQPHNAEHEFYFSTLSEGHLRRLLPLLGS